MHIVLILYLIYSYIIFLSHLPSGAWYHPLLVFLVAGSADASRVCLHEDHRGDHRSRSLFTSGAVPRERAGGTKSWAHGFLNSQRWQFYPTELGVSPSIFFWARRMDFAPKEGWFENKLRSATSRVLTTTKVRKPRARAQLEADFLYPKARSYGNFTTFGASEWQLKSWDQEGHRE